MQEMRDLHLLRALKVGGHKWNPGTKCDSRGAALEGDIFLASRTTREDQDNFTMLQHAGNRARAAVDKSKSVLEAENVALRHQLIVLRRKVQGRVRLTNNDRWFFIQQT